MTRNPYTILVAILLCLSGSLEAQTREWQTYLNGRLVRALDGNDKTLWIAMGDGVVKLDRSTGKMYLFDPGNSLLATNMQSDLCVDSSGTTWFLGPHSLNWYNDMGWHIYEDMPMGRYSASYIEADSKGSVWICTSHGGGLFRFNGTAWTAYTSSEHSLPTDSVWNITVDNNDNIWCICGSEANMVYKFDGAVWTEYPLANSALQSARIADIATDKNGSVWIASDKGLGRLAGGTWTVYTTSNSGLPDNNVNLVMATNDGIWCCADYKAAVHFDGTTWLSHTTTESGLALDMVTTMHIDREGTVWFGSVQEPNVVEFDGVGWKSYQYSSIPAFAATFSLAAKDSVTWIGTDHGLVRFDGTTWNTYTTKNSKLPNDTVRALAMDWHNRVWIGTHKGLASFDGVNWTVYGADVLTSLTGIIDAIAVEGDKIWVATASGGYGVIALFDGVAWSHPSGFYPVIGTRKLLPDGKGNVWFTHGDLPIWRLQGIGKFDGDTTFHFTYEDTGLPEVPIISAAIDSTGNIWVGPNFYQRPGEQKWLAKFDGTSWTKYELTQEFDTLWLMWITSIAVDRNNTVWAGISKGGDAKGGGSVIRFDGTIMSYDNVSNLHICDQAIYDVIAVPNGNIWLGGRDGVAVTYEERLPTAIQESLLPSTPDTYLENSPNPFYTATTICYSIYFPEGIVPVRITVHDIFGRQVATVVNGTQKNGEYQTVFTAENLSPGVYYYRLQAGSHTETRKMVLTR